MQTCCITDRVARENELIFDVTGRDGNRKVRTTLLSSKTTRTQCRPRSSRRITLAADLRSFASSEEVASTRRLRSSEPIKASVRLTGQLLPPSSSQQQRHKADRGRDSSPSKDTSEQHQPHRQDQLPHKVRTPRRRLWRFRLLCKGSVRSMLE